MQKNSKRWIFWILALAAAAAGGGGWFAHRGANGEGAAGYKSAALARGEIVQTVTANGELKAVQTVLVGSEVSGKIVELLADYNSAVTNGQMLARLDASTYERQLEQAEAELESAKASRKLAEANHKRAKELLELNLVSRADFDQTEATLAQAVAAVQVRQASLSKVRVDLEKTTIFSPMDGIVISRSVDAGQTVAASLNAPTLFTISQDLKQMRIEAQISEADVGGVAEGQAVSFTVDAYPARTFAGRVSQVRFEPVTNQGVVNYIAIVDVDNADLKLRPGMTANASVTTAKRENALRLPNSALRFRPPEGAAVASADLPKDSSAGKWKDHDGAQRERGTANGREHREGGAPEAARKTVYVLDEKGGLRAQPVELGISDGTWTEVLGPAPKDGDLIATGIRTAADKETAAKSGANSPFMPHPPGGPRH